MSTALAERARQWTALGEYARYMVYRHRRLDLAEILDETNPVNLRQIFIEPRLADKAVSDDEFTQQEAKLRQKQPGAVLELGRPAFELLAAEPFVALSGAPGSGKSTLIQAVVVELCEDRPSPLREHLPVMPVPIALRFLPVESLESLDALCGAWLDLQVAQAESDSRPEQGPALVRPLDRDALQAALFAPDPAARPRPVLLLFDGIDEVGAPDTRAKVVAWASEALARGYRVLLTGRPAGYEGLDATRDARRAATKPAEGGDNDALTAQLQQLRLAFSEAAEAGGRAGPTALTLHHLLPFHRDQIRDFADAWYALRQEWRVKRDTGLRQFLEHFETPDGARLLTLARRPIFLTLMTHVHTVENRMPEGRPLLYKRIVDLYIERQERHRQRRGMPDGSPVPHWSPNEPRLVLGHLAWLSQTRGAKEKLAHDPSRRLVWWEREQLEQAVRDQLTNGPGRFTALGSDDAWKLVDYFLYPAGLLVEPAEGRVQFAHLSFQEYLCAEYLYGRGRLAGLEPYLQEHLFKHLASPGWDEVGLLLLSLHALETHKEGHFDALTWLDLRDVSQARLAVMALTGGELPFTDPERRAWLPLAVACALAHSDERFGDLLARVPEWKSQGLDLVCKLLGVHLPDAWALLEHDLEAQGARGLSNVDPKVRLDRLRKLRTRWDKPETGGFRDPREVRAHALLALINDAGWGVDSERETPVEDKHLENAFVDWLERHDPPAAGADKPTLVWGRAAEENTKALPWPTAYGLEWERVVAPCGALWRTVTARVPVDAWLLQRELADLMSGVSVSDPVFLLALYPVEPLPPPAQVALGLLQAQRRVELAAFGREFDEWCRLKLRCQPSSDRHSWSTLRSQPQSISEMQSELKLLQWPSSLSRVFSASLSDSRSRSRSRSRSLSDSRSRSRSLPRSLWKSISQFLSTSRWVLQLLSALESQLESQLNSELESLRQTLWQTLWQSISLVQRLAQLEWPSAHTRTAIEKLRKQVPEDTPLPEVWLTALSRYAETCAAWDWFDEEAGDPDLMRRRGLAPGEPLPRALGLFDASGRPHDRDTRESFVKLRRWLDDDEAVLSFLFPAGLTDADRQDLLAQLALLREQPWAPQLAVDALLRDWPEDVPERDVSLAAAERRLHEATEQAIQELERGPSAQQSG